MKKLIALILVLAFAACLFVACAKDPVDDPKDTDAAQTTKAADEEETTTAAEEESTTATEKESVTLAPLPAVDDGFADDFADDPFEPITEAPVLEA